MVEFFAIYLLISGAFLLGRFSMMGRIQAMQGMVQQEKRRADGFRIEAHNERIKRRCRSCNQEIDIPRLCDRCEAAARWDW